MSSHDTEPPKLEIDQRTGVVTAIDPGAPIAGQRSACVALNQRRARAILETAKQASQGRALSLDVWADDLEQTAERLEAPLISLQGLGISHDADGILISEDLIALQPGAEASPYLCRTTEVVYKLFDLRLDGSLGKKIAITVEDDRWELQSVDARLPDIVEKLMVLNEAGAHPTEIVGLSRDGDYLIAKQPLAFQMEDFHEDRDQAIAEMKGVQLRSPGLRGCAVVIWVGERPWLVSDLHQRNVMRNRENVPTVIDALTGEITEKAQKMTPWLGDAIEEARCLAKGIPYASRYEFEAGDDDEL